MQCRPLLVLAALGSTVACWAQGRTDRTTPTTSLAGSVVAFETGDPIPYAEVCVFSSDTTCVRADARGRYRVRIPPAVVTLRFRASGLPPAFLRGVTVVPPELTVTCAISGRVSLADEAACLSAPSR